MTTTTTNAAPTNGTTTIVWDGYVRADEVLPGDAASPYGLVENTVRRAGGFEITFANGESDYFLNDESIFVERTAEVTTVVLGGS